MKSIIENRINKFNKNANSNLSMEEVKSLLDYSNIDAPNDKILHLLSNTYKYAFIKSRECTK